MAENKIDLDALTSLPARREFLANLPQLTADFQALLGDDLLRLGLEVHVAGGEMAICSLGVAGFRQHQGICMGGANALLGECAGSFAASLAAPAGKIAIGTDIQMRHLRVAKSGRIYCLARQLRISANSGVYSLRIYREDGELTAAGSHACVFK
ncbi:MAG: PaaI family thioesterase [Actinomycetaceae bacterium]|nr:PaaI family thioesterase [Actinomycetaceae bacterium]